MTVPLPGPLHAQRERLVELADLGYTDIWSAESDGKNKTRLLWLFPGKALRSAALLDN